MKALSSTLLDVPFTFERKPDPIPGEMRPQWRIAVLLIILQASRGKKASLRKLHVLSWVVRNSQSRERFIRYVNGELASTDIIIRVDPGLNHALALARAERLIDIVSGKTASMTAKGQAFAQEILSYKDTLSEEKDFMDVIKPHIRESKIAELLAMKGKS